MDSAGQALSHRRAMCWASPATNRTKDRAERSRWERAEEIIGPKKRNGRKGVGTQGRRYARLIMRESEEEKAVHVYNVTAHVLYKGMENM